MKSIKVIDDVKSSEDRRGPEIARLLVGRGADTDLQDKDGYTALMIASCKGRAEVARILPDTGADVSLKDKDGLTALMWARKNGHQDIVTLFELT